VDLVRLQTVENSQHEGFVSKVIPPVVYLALLRIKVFEKELLIELRKEVVEQELMINFKLMLVWQLLQKTSVFLGVHEPVLVVVPPVLKVVFNFFLKS